MATIQRRGKTSGPATFDRWGNGQFRPLGSPLLRDGVERRGADHHLLPGSARVPPGRIVREAGLPGFPHFFFDIGHGNYLALFEFRGLDLDPYREVLVGLHHIAISVTPNGWTV